MLSLSGIRKNWIYAIAFSLLVTGCQRPSPLSSDADSELSNYLLAVYAGAQGDRARANEAYLKVLNNKPQNTRLLEEAFSYFLFNGDYKHALGISQEFYAAKPENSPVTMLLALDAFKGGKSEEMEGYLSGVKGFGFDSLMSPIMIAWSKAQAGETDAALAALEPLLGTVPFEPFYRENRAFILDYAGRADEAEVAYSTQITKDDLPSLEPVISFGALLSRQGRDEEATALFNKFLEYLPDNRQLKYSLESHKAGKSLPAVARDPNEALGFAFFRTGVELGRDQNFLPAIVYTRFALYLNPGLDEAYLYLGNLLSSQSTPGLSLDAFSGVAKDGPFYEPALIRKSFVLSRYDRWQEGVNLIEEYLAQDPDNIDALTALGDLYRSREEFSGALDYYLKVSALKGDLNKEDWFLLFARAISFERLGRWEEAEADFLKALEYHPDDPDIMNYLGYSWIDRGLNLEKGRELIERAVAQRPDSGFIVDSLGWAQYLLGEYEAAVETLERAVALEPTDPTLNDHLGDAYWKVGREREARFQWDHALGLDPDPEDRKKIEAKIAYGFSLAEALQDRK